MNFSKLKKNSKFVYIHKLIKVLPIKKYDSKKN
jgi:hypothetical protein